MRKELLGFLLIGGLVGCTSQWDTDRAEASRASTAADKAAPTPAKLVAERGSQRSFASLPDRGELLQYAQDRKARKSGAYTYHPVSISEAHALNAIAKGGMHINMPDGKTLELKYDRYEEQPDGNWTWIGRNADGSEAVLTFGDKAVFGMIASGGQTYDVRTDRAGAWILETNRALLAAGGGHGRRREGPDYLAPPATSASSGNGLIGAAAATSQKQAAISEKAGVNEKAVAVVDVLLGYSAGIVATVGSESGAQTRVASFVALTNNAYQASGVTMRLRLVHSMLVNYSDTGFKNDATLRRLTGYDETTQQNIAVDPAFTALRAAREQYGADLVALIRQYREPEQDGCGIAWLIGMNQRAISPAADAGFGYAVVGDGTDRDESDNNTYKCSQYALAHELGHLMGQAHNTEDAAGRAGAHTYSYGYREAASTGFFTIMAYPRDDTQAANEIGNFANPAVSVSGRPTGVANASDNVLSVNQTMPIISTFRATVVPIVGASRADMNGDGRSDIVWRNPSTGQTSRWYMNGSSVIGGQADSQSPGWRIVGIADFDGDGRNDLLWADTANTSLIMWRPSANNQYVGQYVAAYPAGGWVVAGVGDMNGDGSADIVWHNPTTGQTSRWFMNGAVVVGGQADSQSVGWRIVGIADFDGDGRSDLLWANTANTSLIMWRPAANNQYVGNHVAAYPAGGWVVSGVADMDGDGRADIVWHNPTTGQTSRWFMNGSSVVGGRADSQTPGWRIVAVGDFDGDGRNDLVWADASNANLIMWRPNASGQYVGSHVAAYPAGGWQVANNL